MLPGAADGMIAGPAMALLRHAAESAPNPDDVLRDPDVAHLLGSPDHQGLELPRSRQIYTNRNLRMDAISMVDRKSVV